MYICTRMFGLDGRKHNNALSLAEKGFYYPFRCGVLYNPVFTFLPNGVVMPCICVQDNKFNIGHFKPNIEINEEIIQRLQREE